MTKAKASVLLIYTGGTIGMKEDPSDGTLKPFDFGSLMQEVPELRKFALKIDAYTFDPLIDSSDIEPGMWKKLAELIRKNYDDYDGFVVLHGTDTMAYSAAALSFMLDNLGKPVTFLTISTLMLPSFPYISGIQQVMRIQDIPEIKTLLSTSFVSGFSLYFYLKF